MRLAITLEAKSLEVKKLWGFFELSQKRYRVAYYVCMVRHFELLTMEIYPYFLPIILSVVVLFNHTDSLEGLGSITLMFIS